MKFNILKTRQGRLEEKIKNELSQSHPSIEEILKHVTEFEKENLETIDKLKKEKSVETKKISGALKQAIHAHGPITKELIGSATKRIYGALLVNETKKQTLFERIRKWVTSK